MRLESRITTVILLFLLVVVGGCAKFQALMTLKSVGDSQSEIERYLAKQEKLFNNLVRDVKENALRPGISKSQFLKTYGEPIIVSRQQSLAQQERLFYRHPTEYFTSDRVYVYFDDGKLVRWEYKPYQKTE